MFSTEGRPVVFVVDDEPLVRLNTAAIVEDAGFEVLEAATADAAIRLLEQRSEIRVVFADIRMPGSMDGVALAQAIRERWPPVSVVLTSGDVAGPALAKLEGRPFLPKPHDAKQINQVLSHLLQS